jgi:hypothetical protein
VQKVDNRYEGRKGATLYLPVDEFDSEAKMGETALLKGTDYAKFQQMIFDAPMRRGVVDQLFTNINRVTEQMRADKKSQTPEEQAAAKQMEEMKKGAGKKMKEMKERMHVKSLEEAPEMSAGARVARSIGIGIKNAFTLVGALAGGAVGLVIGAPIGAVLGTVAGFRGGSLVSKSHEEPLEKKAKGPSDPMKDMQKMMDPMAAIKDAVPGLGRLIAQGALAPAEYVGETVNKKVSYSHGTIAGKAAGTVAGAAGGTLGGAAAGFAVGGLVGGAIARGISTLVTFWTPKPPSKPQEPGFMGIPLGAMMGGMPEDDEELQEFFGKKPEAPQTPGTPQAGAPATAGAPAPAAPPEQAKA